MLQSINAFRLSQCLYVISRLGIADLLKDGPMPYEELAKKSGAHPVALFRLLRALATFGIFNQLDMNRFELTDEAEYLCRDTPGSLHAWAILVGEQTYTAWGNLLYTIQSGEIAFDDLYGMSIWDYRAQNPAAGKVFDEAMSEIFRASNAAIVEAYNFSRFQRIVDVGGGKGELIAAILKANPTVRGVLFDQAPAIESGKALLKEAGVLERCETVAGNFLRGIPDGGDAYILKDVLHDWDEAKAVEILENCRRAMQEYQTLLVIERLIPSERPTPEAVMTDLTMMVMNGGRERTREEFQALLGKTSFELAKVLPTRSLYQIVEARAV